jgi:group I intron endonuclease
METENIDFYKVYKYTSPSNKVYIGQTKRPLNKRSCGSSGKGYKHCSRFYDAIQKYGFENFQIEILKDNLDKESADFWEEYYINEYKSNDEKYGYNIASGGKNVTISESARKKKSENMKINNPMYDPQTSEKVKEKLKGRKLSKEIVENIRKGHMKKVQCIETGEIFNSRNEAGLFYNVSPSGIGRAINGEQKTCANKHWRYI